MSPSIPIPALQDLELLPFLDAEGAIPAAFAGKIGAYAIYDREGTLQLVDYSRDISFGLLQHLIRQPEKCYGVRVYAIERPSRTVLEAIRQTWLAAHGSVPAGNGVDAALWQEPIDVRHALTPSEVAACEAAGELERGKILKQAARRCQEERLARLQARGATVTARFNPKLKEKGLLDLNPSKR